MESSGGRGIGGSEESCPAKAHARCGTDRNRSAAPVRGRALPGTDGSDARGRRGDCGVTGSYVAMSGTSRKGQRTCSGASVVELEAESEVVEGGG